MDGTNQLRPTIPLDFQAIDWGEDRKHAPTDMGQEAELLPPPPTSHSGAVQSSEGVFIDDGSLAGVDQNKLETTVTAIEKHDPYKKLPANIDNPKTAEFIIQSFGQSHTIRWIREQLAQRAGMLVPEQDLVKLWKRYGDDIKKYQEEIAEMTLATSMVRAGVRQQRLEEVYETFAPAMRGRSTKAAGIVLRTIEESRKEAAVLGIVEADPDDPWRSLVVQLNQQNVTINVNNSQESPSEAPTIIEGQTKNKSNSPSKRSD